MTKPLKFWSVTIQSNYGELPSVQRMKEICEEFALQWVFQRERGKKANKAHYQGRIILKEGQPKHTMIYCFESRGIHQNDITFSPESNKSLNQGGLTFYVMKDETREEGPWHDVSFKPPKKRSYDGSDLKVMDTPFPWQQKVIDMVQNIPDDRTVNWIFNDKGCAGKSKLMKYMRWNSERFDMARIPLGTATRASVDSCRGNNCHPENSPLRRPTHYLAV
jgi:hypothetical protein